MKILINNQKANFNYEILEKMEAGISLFGSEVKSIIKGDCSIDEAFVILKKQEAYVINMYIAPYLQANINNHEPTRNRKLLLHKNEILKLELEIKKQKLALIITKVYLVKNKIKIEIGLAKSKKQWQKKEKIKEKDILRETNKSYKM